MFSPCGGRVSAIVFRRAVILQGNTATVGQQGRIASASFPRKCSSIEFVALGSDRNVVDLACFDGYIGVALENPAQRLARLERNAEARLKAVCCFQRHDQTVRFAGLLNAPAPEPENVSSVLIASLLFDGARQEMRQGHNDGFRLIERKLDSHRRAGAIQKPQSDVRAIAGDMAGCQFLAANLGGHLLLLFSAVIFRHSSLYSVEYNSMTGSLEALSEPGGCKKPIGTNSRAADCFAGRSGVSDHVEDVP
jgi:hypothetical protein